MIQRLQTLFLFLAISAIVIMMFYPVSSITEYTQLNTQSLETDYYELFVTGLHDPSPTSAPQTSQSAWVPLMVLTVMVLAIIGYTIFRYKSRLFQLKLVKSAIFLNIVLVTGIFLNYPKIFTHTTVSIDPGPGAYFPLISLIMLVIAHRYILKDERLVRSSDRLR